ncbi:hypothetical protein FKM82_018065 [Ascaphus truei]
MAGTFVLEEMLLTSRGTVRRCHILCYMLYTVCSISLVPGTCNYHQVPTGSQYPAEYCNPGPVQSRRCHQLITSLSRELATGCNCTPKTIYINIYIYLGLNWDET